MMKSVLLLVFAGCAGLAHAQTWNLTWADEFNGAILDTATWNIEVNDDGGFNNELQYYTNRTENLRVENGNLVIEARREPWLTRDYTSARINTNRKFSWKYGRIEARMKLPYGAGTWPAFWMLSEDTTPGNSGEIDITELIGGNSCEECGDNQTYGAIHWNGDNGRESITGRGPTLDSGIFHDAFHRFSIEWDPVKISLFVDDTLFKTAVFPESSREIFRQPFYLLLNLAIGGDWPGSPDGDTEWPQQLLVDYIRIYEPIPAIPPGVSE